MVELLSHIKMVQPSCSLFNFSRILLIHTVWQAQVATATNSALVVDRVTIGCFFDDHETAHPLSMKT